jgi:hypothetical protein
VFNATFSNISAISWQPAIVVEEAGVPGINQIIVKFINLPELRIKRIN